MKTEKTKKKIPEITKFVMSGMDVAEYVNRNEQEHQDIAEEQQVSFHKIEELESFGVNKTDITKLKTGGYHTIEAASFTFGFMDSLMVVPDCPLYSSQTC